VILSTRIQCVAAGAAALSGFACSDFISGNWAAHAQQAGAEMLPDIVVTADRIAEPLARTGSAITIIDKATIATSNPSSLADALRSVPGVDVTETSGPGSVTSVRIRGANSGQTLVLIDGMRVNDPTGTAADFDFAALAPGLVDRMEVLRGPQSALYGSDAIGGVVNIITGKGGGEPHADVRVEAGRYGAVAITASVSGSQGPWTYSFAGSGQQRDGFSSYGYRIPTIEQRFPNLEADGLQRVGGYGRIGYDPGTGARVELGALGIYTNSNYDAAFGSLPDTPSTAKRGLYQVWAKGSLDTFDGALTHELRVSANRIDRAYNDVSYFGSMAPQNTYTSLYTYLGDRIEGEYQGNLRLGFLGSLIFGGRLEHDAATLYTTNLTPVFTPRALNLRAVQDTRSAFALWQWPIGDRLVLSLGGRYDDIVDVDHFSTWRASAAYLVPEAGGKLRASAGTGGKAPSLYQLYAPLYGNAALQSERSFGWDAGYDQTLFDGRTTVSLTGFSNRFNNLIDFDTTTSHYLNVSRAEAHGLEAGGDIELVPNWVRFKAAYTYLHAIDLATRLTLQRRPAHTARLALPITPLAGWLIEPRLYYTAQRYSTTNGRDRLPPYVRLDLYSDYALQQNLRVFARIENVTNVRYQEVLNYGTSGRAGYAGFNFTW
jgi:vitamin B12 transporter